MDVKKQKYWIAVLIITILGGLLRIINISDFNIYSDTYESLLIVKNIVEHFSVDGNLREGGMYWAPLFYNRAGMALFIIPLYYVFRDLEFAAHMISVLAGIISIPLVYVFAWRIFNSRKIGIISCFLFAISFSLTAWSGLITSDSLAIFLTLVTLNLFIYAVNSSLNASFKKILLILAGIFLAITCFVRMELLLLLIPLLFLFTAYIEKPKKYIVLFISVFFASYILINGLVLLTLQSFNDWLKWQMPYFQEISVWAVPIFILSILFLYLLWKLEQKLNNKRSYKIIYYSLIILFIIVIIFFIALRFDFNFLESIIRVDFLVIISGLSGLLLLIKKDKKLAIFFLLYLIPLWICYRGFYFQHLTQIFILLCFPAGFFIFKIALSLKNRIRGKSKFFQIIFVIVIVSICICASLWQLRRSLGFYEWHMEISYEKKAAQETDKIIKENNIPDETILLTYFVKPYYLYTGLPSWKLGGRDFEGFQNVEELKVFFKSLPAETAILIVLDEGVGDQVPDIAKYIKGNFNAYLLGDFEMNVPYLHDIRKYYTDEPVELYYIEEIGKIKESKN